MTSNRRKTRDPRARGGANAARRGGPRTDQGGLRGGRLRPGSVKEPSGWPAVALAALVVVWTATMLVSLRWQFLDRFFAGTWIGTLGIDFFQIPRGFRNLLAGNSIFFTEIDNYGPRATPYFNHPLVAVAIGSWASLFSPWTGYALFVGFSLLLLFLAARILASAFDAPTSRAFVYVAVFCSLPTYLMLWAGQVHVLLVLAVAMIFAGLMRLAQEPQPRRAFFLWIQLGILISLLSKPSVALMLPVLLIVPETRRKLLLPLAIYALVSLAFLLLDKLNPDGLNAIHWLNMAKASSSSIQILWIATPSPNSVFNDNGVYSLPVILGRTLGESSVWSWLPKLPLAAIAAMSLVPLIARAAAAPAAGRSDGGGVHSLPLPLLLFGAGISLHDLAAHLARVALAVAQRGGRPAARAAGRDVLGFAGRLPADLQLPLARRAGPVLDRPAPWNAWRRRRPFFSAWPATRPPSPGRSTAAGRR